MNKIYPVFFALIMVSNVQAVKPCAADADTLALWHLDEAGTVAGTVDASGHKMDLKKEGKGELKSVKGIFGNAVTGFHPQGGKDQRLLAPPPYKLGNPPTQTFEAWIMWPDAKLLPRSKNNPRGWYLGQVLFLRSGSLMPVRFELQKGGEYGRMQVTFISKKGAKPVVFAADLPKIEAGKWYHIAMTTEPQGKDFEVKFFLTPQDNTEPVLKPFATHVFKNFKPSPYAYIFRLGEDGHTGAFPFTGVIDEVRISKVARKSFDTFENK
jgi:hypothetical protein